MTNLNNFSKQVALHRNVDQNAIKHADFPEAYYQIHSDKITKIMENLRDKKKTRLPPRTIFKR